MKTPQAFGCRLGRSELEFDSANPDGSWRPIGTIKMPDLDVDANTRELSVVLSEMKATSVAIMALVMRLRKKTRAEVSSRRVKTIYYRNGAQYLVVRE